MMEGSMMMVNCHNSLLFITLYIWMYHKLPQPSYLLFLFVSQSIKMQMRFDGRLGFPGGFVDDDDETLELALHRELTEEMGDLPPTFQVTPEDYMFAHLFKEKKCCLHFYCKEVSFADFKIIEKREAEEPFEGFEVRIIFQKKKKENALR